MTLASSSSSRTEPEPGLNRFQNQLPTTNQSAHPDSRGQSTASHSVSPQLPGTNLAMDHDGKARSEISSMFHWNSRSGVGKKRKGSTPRKSQLSAKKKLPSWTHMFVCLASCTQNSVPDSNERASLQIAGLGEERVTFYLSSEAQDIYHELLYQFPKLSHDGGFELLRVPEGGGKQIDVIAVPESGYTIPYLKAVVHHAKVFVRPMQKNLPLHPDEKEVHKENIHLCV